jgi:hypothetical protein
MVSSLKWIGACSAPTIYGRGRTLWVSRLGVLLAGAWTFSLRGCIPWNGLASQGSKVGIIFPPNSTNFMVTNMGESEKYATMINDKSRKRRYHLLHQHVTQSVNCPFHYTEG